MDRHKIKPDSKAFNLVQHKKIYEFSCMSDKHGFYRIYFCVTVLVTKTIDDGSKQAHYIRAFYAGCLLPRGATANTGV